ncbi:MAG TPA: hypothetical protein DEH11_18540 [Actinobacteria bacterium]|nr:hypothetical protein [Actinomycetota bacterium]
MQDDAHDLADRARHECGLPGSAGSDHPGGEFPRQHGWLELQQSVQDPQQPEGNLDRPPRHARPG